MATWIIYVNNERNVGYHDVRRGMHVSPAKHSSASVTDGQTDEQTDRRTDRRTTDKVIPTCRYASQATQKSCEVQMR